MKWWDQLPWSSFFECWVLSQLSYSPLSLSSSLFIVCHKGGVICISEVIDISPGNLNSSLCFFQPSVLLSHVQLLVTPWTAAHQASLSITNFQSLLKLMSIESVMLSNHLILCHPLLLLPSIFPSIRVFSSEPLLENITSYVFPRGKEFQWSENLKTLSTNAWAVLSPSVVSDFFQCHVL